MNRSLKVKLKDQIRALQDAGAKRKYQSDLNYTEDKRTKVGDMDRDAAALIHTRTQMGRSTKVGDEEYFLRR